MSLLTNIVLIIILGIAFAVALLYFYDEIRNAFRSVEDTALLDKETGLFKSDYFLHLVTASLETFDRYQAPFTLLIFNISAMGLGKLPADTKAEIMGSIGQKIKGAIRLNDQAGRPSNDSVAIILYNTGAGSSKIVAKRVTGIFNKVLPDVTVRETTWTVPADLGLIRLYAEPK
jgi:GGDEF domain-containing protein